MMNEAGGDSKAGQARWGNDRLPRAKLRSPDTHAAFVPAQLRCAGRPHTQTESVSLLLQGEHPVLQKDEAPGDTVSHQESPGLVFGLRKRTSAVLARRTASRSYANFLKHDLRAVIFSSSAERLRL